MDNIDFLLTRGVDNIYPSQKMLEGVLRSGKKLRLYQGFDPTGTQMHIGHMVGLRKLRQWQDLGHEVIFLIGDGTGQAGDPSGKMKARERFMTREELRENARDYVMQAGKIVRFDGENPIRILYNSDWLNKLTLVEILSIAQNFSVQQLIERDMYQERMKRGDSINLREFLYPLLQGYDSVAMEVDLEQGGTDQMFNMLAGRTLVGAMLHKEKFVMTVPLLADSKGVKIGKTEGNVIGLTDNPVDFYGKIMALSDDAIIPCFTLLTDIGDEQLAGMKSSMANGDNPMILKKRLAYALTAQLNSDTDARKAEIEFENRFQKKDLDDSELQTLSLDTWNSAPTLADALVQTGLAASKSEARRLIAQGAIDIDGVTISDPKMRTKTHAATIIKIGKTRAFRITS